MLLKRTSEGILLKVKIIVLFSKFKKITMLNKQQLQLGLENLCRFFDVVYMAAGNNTQSAGYLAVLTEF